MQDITASLISIFEHFSDQLNSEKNNFRSPEVWDQISSSIRRIYRIDSFFGHDFKVNYKHPLIIDNELDKYNSFCQINELYKGLLTNDVIKVSFNKFYPNIICRLYEEGTLDVNIKTEPYYYLVKNGDGIKKKLTQDAIICFNLYINYFFGLKLNNDERQKVVRRGYLIIESLTKFEWIYADTDEIFFKDSIGLINDLKSEIDYMELPYEIELIREMVIFDRKKFSYVDSNGFGKIKGFRKIKR